MSRRDRTIAREDPYGEHRVITRSSPSTTMGGSIGEFEYADFASTANLSLVGTPTIDGGATAGKRVLAKNQTAPGQNGLYDVSPTGDWLFLGQPRVVAVLNGTTQGQTFFVLTAANTYSPGGAYFK